MFYYLFYLMNKKILGKYKNIFWNIIIIFDKISLTIFQKFKIENSKDII